MTRSFTELAGWLVRDNPVPAGSVLLTGTGLVPPDAFTLLAGHTVEISVPQIGTLVNPVVSASLLVDQRSSERNQPLVIDSGPQLRRRSLARLGRVG